MGKEIKQKVGYGNRKLLVFERDGFIFSEIGSEDYINKSIHGECYFKVIDKETKRHITNMGYGRASYFSSIDYGDFHEMKFETSFAYVDYIRPTLKEMIPLLKGIKNNQNIKDYEDMTEKDGEEIRRENGKKI